MKAKATINSQMAKSLIKRFSTSVNGGPNLKENILQKGKQKTEDPL